MVKSFDRCIEGFDFGVFQLAEAIPVVTAVEQANAQFAGIGTERREAIEKLELARLE
jgi:hypothetical protein